MTQASHPDKKGEALKQQRFRMLEDIAREMSEGDIVFPTAFDIVTRVRDALRNPEVTVKQIVALIQTEPLICARLIHQANAAALGATPVTDVTSAVKRLGINAVRNAALAIAMSQLVRAKELVGFRQLSYGLWVHSLHTAAAAEIIVRELALHLKAEEAMFAGLVHDLGAFYMLYRAAQYEELRERPDTVRHLIVQWHESIGESLLYALQLPEGVIEAVRDHDHPREPLMEPPRKLPQVVYAANVLAGGSMEWVDDAAERVLGECYTVLAPRIETRLGELKQDYAG